MAQVINKNTALKEVASSKQIPPVYSEVLRKWCTQMQVPTPSHVVLYLDDALKKLFVTFAHKPPTVYGFVLDLTTNTATEVKKYTMQVTKERKTYVMADKSQFVMAGFFKAPVLANTVNTSGIRPSSRASYRSIASTEIVNEVSGIKFHVNVEVEKGAENKEASIAFYDARYFTERNGVGQFVSSYFVSSIREHNTDLILDGGVPNWWVTHRNIRQLHDWLAVEF